MLHRIWDKDGNSQEVQHFDLDAWIADGWLTSKPEPVEDTEAIAPKRKAKAAPVETEQN